jgi:succinate dehydrogenase / fumarate reductase iron-sulfur subunit
MPEVFDTYIFHVFRYDSTEEREPHFETYSVEYQPGLTVLGGLLQIQDQLDGSLSFRCSCRSAVCGSCGMVVNGSLQLACRLQLASLELNEVTLEPLPNLDVIKDLVVDMQPFWEAYHKVEPWLQTQGTLPSKELLQSEQDRKKIDQYVNCILCACCYGACPVLNRDSEYPGPAALVWLHRFMADSRDQRADSFVEMVNSESGLWGCDTVLRCIEACPKDVRPTDAIEALRRRYVWYRIKKFFGFLRGGNRHGPPESTAS